MGRVPRSFAHWHPCLDTGGDHLVHRDNYRDNFRTAVP